jgi:alpha-galactosidase
MVKPCTREDHTHDPRDSNYSNSVNGINAVLRAIQQARPSVLWENCEDGGNMMTFNMVRHYVTSITNDANGSLGARQAVWGATYPFPPRYADRYMIENELGPYVTRSHIFGGPWIFMNKLLDLSPEELDFAASEVRLFKAIRGKVRDGKVYRLTDRPEEGRVDAIQAYHAESDSAVAVVTRDGSASARFMLRLRGLNPEATYRVRFQDDPRSMALTGAQLMNQGIAVNLRDVETAEVVHIDPM